MARRLAPEAKTDRVELWFYVAGARSIDTADRFVDSITARFLSILAKSLLIGRTFAAIDLLLFEHVSHRSGFDVPGGHSQRCCRSGLPRVGAHEGECW